MNYIKRFESYYTIEEFIFYVTEDLKKYNIMQSELNHIINFYKDKIEDYHNEGKNPFEVSNIIAKELKLQYIGFNQYKKIVNKNQQNNYL